jgi:hypothetical protein
VLHPQADAQKAGAAQKLGTSRHASFNEVLASCMSSYKSGDGASPSKLDDSLAPPFIPMFTTPSLGERFPSK